MSSLPPGRKSLPATPPSPTLAPGARSNVALLQKTISRAGTSVRKKARGVVRAATMGALGHAGSVVADCFRNRMPETNKAQATGAPPPGAPPPVRLGLAESSDEDSADDDAGVDGDGGAPMDVGPARAPAPGAAAVAGGRSLADEEEDDANAGGGGAMVVAGPPDPDPGDDDDDDDEEDPYFDGASQSRWIDSGLKYRTPIADLQFADGRGVEDQTYRFVGYEMKSVLLRSRIRDMEANNIRMDDYEREAKEINRLLYQMVRDHRKATIMDVRSRQYDATLGHGPEAFDCAAFYMRGQESKWYFGYYMHQALAQAIGEVDIDQAEHLYNKEVADKASELALKMLTNQINKYVAADEEQRDPEVLFADREAYIPSSSRENEWKPATDDDLRDDENNQDPRTDDRRFLLSPTLNPQFWEDVVADHVARANMGQGGDPLRGDTREWAIHALRNMFELMLTMTRDEYRITRVLDELRDYRKEDHAETMELDNAIKVLHAQTFMLAHFKRLAYERATELGVDDDALVHEYDQLYLRETLDRESYLAAHRVHVFAKMWNVVWAQLETLHKKRAFQFAAAAERRAVQEFHEVEDDEGELIGDSVAYYEGDAYFGPFMNKTGSWLRNWIGNQAQPTLAAYDPEAGAAAAPQSGALALQGGHDGGGAAGPSADAGALDVAPAAGMRDDGLPLPGYNPRYKKPQWRDFHKREDMTPCPKGFEKSIQPYREWNTTLKQAHPPEYVPTKTDEKNEAQRIKDAQYLNMLVDELEAHGISGETVQEYNKRAIARSSESDGGTNTSQDGGSGASLGMWTAGDYKIRDDLLRSLAADSPWNRDPKDVEEGWGFGHNKGLYEKEKAGGAYLPATAFAVEYGNKREAYIREALCVLLSEDTPDKKYAKLVEIQNKINYMGPFDKESSATGKDKDHWSGSTQGREDGYVKKFPPYFLGGQGLSVLTRLEDNRNKANGTYRDVLPKEGTGPLGLHTFLSWYYNETFRWWRDVAPGGRSESTDFFALGSSDRTRIRWSNWMRFNLRLMAGLPLEIDFRPETCRWVRNDEYQKRFPLEDRPKNDESDPYFFKDYNEHVFRAVQSGLRTFFRVWKLANMPRAAIASTKKDDPWGSGDADYKVRTLLGGALASPEDPGRVNNPNIAERYQLSWRLPYAVSPLCNDEYRMYRPEPQKLAIGVPQGAGWTVSYKSDWKNEEGQPLYHDLQPLSATTFKTTSDFKILDLLRNRDLTHHSVAQRVAQDAGYLNFPGYKTLYKMGATLSIEDPAECDAKKPPARGTKLFEDGDLGEERNYRNRFGSLLGNPEPKDLKKLLTLKLPSETRTIPKLKDIPDPKPPPGGGAGGSGSGSGSGSDASNAAGKQRAQPGSRGSNAAGKQRMQPGGDGGNASNPPKKQKQKALTMGGMQKRQQANPAENPPPDGENVEEQQALLNAAATAKSDRVRRSRADEADDDARETREELARAASRAAQPASPAPAAPAPAAPKPTAPAAPAPAAPKPTAPKPTVPKAAAPAPAAPAPAAPKPAAPAPTPVPAPAAADSDSDSEEDAPLASRGARPPQPPASPGSSVSSQSSSRPGRSSKARAAMIAQAKARKKQRIKTPAAGVDLSTLTIEE